MTIERSGVIQICPYWRKYVSYGDKMLALCGSASKQEMLPQSNSKQDDKPHLVECPYGYEQSEASYAPAIIEADRETFAMIQGSPWGMSGEEGIKYLEEFWDREVEKFIQRHSQ